MNRAKIRQQAVSVFVVFALLFGLTGYKNNVYAASAAETHILKQGTQGDEVEKFQEKLKELNFFNADVTGFFGNITKNSVMKFQRSAGLGVDGVAGPQTMNALFNQQQQRTVRATTVSRGDIDRQNILVPWFNVAEDIFAVGTEAVVTDVDTGISFKVERTGGTNHSDTETLSKEDTALLKKIYGGEWSWERRSVIVTTGKWKIAASPGRKRPGLHFVIGTCGILHKIFKFQCYYYSSIQYGSRKR